MSSRAARDDFQVKNAFFLDGDFIQGAGVGDNGDAAADARLFEEKTRPVLPAYFFVRGYGHAERYARMALMKGAEDLNQDSQLSFHVAAARAIDSSVHHRRAVLRIFSAGNYVEVRQQHYGGRGNPVG